jgi:hypothetical protein
MPARIPNVIATSSDNIHSQSHPIPLLNAPAKEWLDPIAACRRHSATDCPLVAILASLPSPVCSPSPPSNHTRQWLPHDLTFQSRLRTNFSPNLVPSMHSPGWTTAQPAVTPTQGGDLSPFMLCSQCDSPCPPSTACLLCSSFPCFRPFLCFLCSAFCNLISR